MAIQHLQGLLNIFHKEYLDKSIAISPFIDLAPLTAKLTTKSFAERSAIKQKCGQFTKTVSANKFFRKS